MSGTAVAGSVGLQGCGTLPRKRPPSRARAHTPSTLELASGVRAHKRARKCALPLPPPPATNSSALPLTAAAARPTARPPASATELNFHSPQTKGWQSPRFCEFPCEIGLAFLDGAASISLVQLLSHQHKIATRVELFTGSGSDYMSAQFTRLGYLSLDSNEKSGFKARELKSVYLKARGQFLKLLLHRCYANPLNLFSQVGLIAINALGQPAAAIADLVVLEALDGHPTLAGDRVEIGKVAAHGGSVIVTISSCLSGGFNMRKPSAVLAVSVILRKPSS